MKSTMRTTIIGILLFAAHSIHAQGIDFDAYKKQAQEKFHNYRNQKQQEFENYRQQANAEYAEFMRQKWELFYGKQPEPAPVMEDKPVPPVVIPDDKINETPIDKPVIIQDILDIKPITITPPSPIEPIPEIEELKPLWFNFTFYGTPCKVRLGDSQRFRFQATNENALADTWNRLSGEDYNNLINDCLQLRDKMALCDWAYLQLTEQIGDNFLGKGSNESVFLQVFLLLQSGYKVRLAKNNEGQLHLLFASDLLIYEYSYFLVNKERFYLYKKNQSNQMEILPQSYANEQAVDLQIFKAQRFDNKPSNERQLTSDRYPNVSVHLSTNRNLMDFFNTYPVSTLKSDALSKWKIYAQTPLSKDAQQQLYPSLRSAIAGKSETEAANILLNFVQTAFEYGYDDDIWGGDRAFFAEETLHYPYSDCEDRAILFSRLVRDLLGLKVVLVYYPGHLATAVKFNSSATGDYLKIGDERYLVCDPTYIGAKIGLTMPTVDNAEAKVVVLY